MKLENLEKWLKDHGYTYSRRQAGSSYFKNVAPISRDYIEVLFDYSDGPTWTTMPALCKYIKRYNYKYTWHTYGGGVYYLVFIPSDLDALDLYFYYQQQSSDLFAKLYHNHYTWAKAHAKQFNTHIGRIMNIYGRRYLDAAGRCY